MQGWQYGKGLMYLRLIFQLTKLAFHRARATLKKNTIMLLKFEFKFVKWFPKLSYAEASRTS